MRKRKKGRKLSLKRDQRKALLRSLSEALLTKEKIETTMAHAKEVSVLVDKIITKGKENSPASVRGLKEKFSDRLVRKIANEIAPKYAQRKGGYTRIRRLAPRKSDGAKMAIIELVK